MKKEKLMEKDVKKILRKMTLKEKASFVSGADFWHIDEIKRLGIPGMMVSDGPHGLRKNNTESDNVNESIQAVCFPAACATAGSFDRKLMNDLGKILGNECLAENVGVLLGPAINMKRSPLCGRNFEYVSEDPYLAGELAASYIEGVQSMKVGTSLKHFAANNQEFLRLVASSDIDERTLYEIYLPAFEKAVRKAKPWTVMCSYNRINGVYSSENEWLLTQVLRKQWGYKGMTVSDWGAVNDRIAGIMAGLDLEMPSSNKVNDIEIINAVKRGKLPMEKLDAAVLDILKTVKKYEEAHTNKRKYVFDREADHSKAVNMAKECIVLLKNEGGVLPLKPGRIAFIGEFAKKPRFQGGGSSHINSYKIENTYDSAVKILKDSKKDAGSLGYAIKYAQGYTLPDIHGFSARNDEIDKTLEAEALKLAKNSDTVVFFAGLPDSYESEGFDRSHMKLPQNQNDLIEKIRKHCKNMAVVLNNGSPVEMPWADGVSSILEAYLTGEGSGAAVAEILLGRANPCAKLAETFPEKLSDNPSYLNFPGRDNHVPYSEGIFIGYRYYDRKEMDVLFPFGHGLSYTEFEYEAIKVKQLISVEKAVDGFKPVYEVSFDIKNTGKVTGKEIAEIYVSCENDEYYNPVRELKNFKKVEIKPDEKVRVTVTLDSRAFAHYDTNLHCFIVKKGTYCILVGKSSRNIVLTAKVNIKDDYCCSKKPKKGDMLFDGSIYDGKDGFIVNRNTSNYELARYPELKKLADRLLKPYSGSIDNNDDKNEIASEAVSDKMNEMMGLGNPLRAMRSFGKITNRQLDEVINKLNKAPRK
jgi:beta-glucosidase